MRSIVPHGQGFAVRTAKIQSTCVLHGPETDVRNGDYARPTNLTVGELMSVILTVRITCSIIFGDDWIKHI